MHQMGEIQQEIVTGLSQAYHNAGHGAQVSYT